MFERNILLKSIAKTAQYSVAHNMVHGADLVAILMLTSMQTRMQYCLHICCQNGETMESQK